MPEVTRLAVLEHARHIAQEKGAVKNGSLFFEDANGDQIHASTVEVYPEARERVCRVCMAGAIFLAKLELGVNVTSPFPDLRAVEDAAVDVVGDDDPVYASAGAITERGTPYVLEVLDRMIDAERAKAPVA